MKYIFTLLIAIILIQISKANNIDCASSGLTFLPEKKEISLNSMFIIEGYQYGQKTIISFKNRRVYLENKKGETVDLVLLKIHKGQMSLTQAIFKPKKELNANSIYFLKISNQTKSEKIDFYKWNSTTSKREPIYWKTSNKKHINFLKNDLKIQFKKTELILYGCGPSVNAIFDIKTNDQSEVWYKTELINLTTKTKKVYIIRKWQNQLNVGHGMCSGAFIFNQKGNYKVRFTPMNTDGKMNKTTKWYTFKNPNINQKGFGF